MIKLGIIGGSGFTGSSLIELLKNHQNAKIEIVTSTSYAGKKVNEIYPDIISDLCFSELNYDELNKLDVVFLAVPHNSAKEIAPNLKCKIIDLTGDHRLTHTYGLPEIFKDEISKSNFIANPGCYATSCLLSVYPIKDEIEYVVFDSISGYSGGGRNNEYDIVENIIAYNLTSHRHKLEMKNILPFDFSFTPHVVNAFRGLMTTSFITLKRNISVDEIKSKYTRYYKDTFTKVVDYIPCTKEVAYTPFCLLGGFERDGSQKIIIISVIDNLLKGAASQAIENMNLMFDLNSKIGL